MSIIQVNTEDWESFVSQCTVEQIRALGGAVFNQMEVNKEKMVELTNCPICNEYLKPEAYKPSIPQVNICFRIIELHMNGYTHVHIKTSLGGVDADHRDHTVLGDINNHYSKMLYLGLIERCDEEGNSVDHFAPIDERDVGDAKLSRFKVGKLGHDFVHGKTTINRISILNRRVVNVEEDKGITYRVQDLKNFEEDSWRDDCANYSLSFPEDLLPVPVPIHTGFLFHDMEDEEE